MLQAPVQLKEKVDRALVELRLQRLKSTVRLKSG
jgi:hypothetical protein